jgi:hypothetical protein
VACQERLTWRDAAGLFGVVIKMERSTIGFETVFSDRFSKVKTRSPIFDVGEIYCCMVHVNVSDFLHELKGVH